MTLKPAMVSGLLIAAITGYVGYHAIYLKQQGQLRVMQAQLQEQQQTQALREQVAGALSEVERLRKHLPQELDTGWLGREVNRLAEEAGIQLASITPQSPRKLEAATVLTVTLRLTTSYHRLGKFVGMLESAPTFLQVNEAILTRNADGMADVQLTVSTLHVPPVDATTLPAVGS